MCPSLDAVPHLSRPRRSLRAGNRGVSHPSRQIQAKGLPHHCRADGVSPSCLTDDISEQRPIHGPHCRANGVSQCLAYDISSSGQYINFYLPTYYLPAYPQCIPTNFILHACRFTYLLLRQYLLITCLPTHLLTYLLTSYYMPIDLPTYYSANTYLSPACLPRVPTY